MCVPQNVNIFGQKVTNFRSSVCFLVSMVFCLSISQYVNYFAFTDNLYVQEFVYDTIRRLDVIVIIGTGPVW